MIIPVLDLMIGQIVLAQGGNRDAYRPVQSRLTNSSQPLEVAQAIFNQTGCDWLYIADIDSFAGATPNWPIYNQLLERGLGLWIDAYRISGQHSSKIKDQLLGYDRLKVIVSSETNRTADQFSVFDELKDDGLSSIFSLDKKGDAVITQTGELADRAPLELVQMACDKGIDELIILDLCEVGTRNGFQGQSAASTLIEEIRSERKDVTLTSGGGVRNADDVRHWIESGCDHVLVASAIHDCAITPDEVSSFG